MYPPGSLLLLPPAAAGPALTPQLRCVLGTCSQVMLARRRPAGGPPAGPLLALDARGHHPPTSFHPAGPCRGERKGRVPIQPEKAEGAGEPRILSTPTCSDACHYQPPVSIAVAGPPPPMTAPRGTPPAFFGSGARPFQARMPGARPNTPRTLSDRHLIFDSGGAHHTPIYHRRDGTTIEGHGGDDDALERESVGPLHTTRNLAQHCAPSPMPCLYICLHAPSKPKPRQEQRRGRGVRCRDGPPKGAPRRARRAPAPRLHALCQHTVLAPLCFAPLLSASPRAPPPFML
jgi:hypothetical protein